MNLQPIYPAWPNLTLPKACTNCGKDVQTQTGFADLEGPPFEAYLCVQCVSTYHMRHGQVVAALEERDRRERRPQHPQRYALEGRIASPS